ncbi:hypothetical protein HA464_08565 [Rhizobium leguminosarum bv. trifolii]|uniref:Aminoglycoside phosphotransferase domain-containing protein n=1 Tax=Rhizobium ruizarguesonis TaxID=2081791 RepID=A0AAE8QI22_9HYPH|nr:hypothetical protein [Rhizobium leguminosarum]NEH33927.1 hypothetical protein [Rhizobium ruizarguesonis]NKL11491.1 hypothetical protein [Rhizobium leguminosarum bv. viciae]QIO47174.1 hypothetical protein HA464_08565 [Rhizobium leguminosarum bv. trifolii]MBY5892645.1 hypothetical protein [Rhizobium leguminosarum]
MSPSNFVFRSGRPLANIDFDSASPGSRPHDLGYAAWTLLDLGDDAIDRPSCGRGREPAARSSRRPGRCHICEAFGAPRRTRKPESGRSRNLLSQEERNLGDDFR